MIKPYIWKTTIGNLCILVQSHPHATPQGEVSIGHTVTVRTSDDAMVICCEERHGDEPYGQPQHSTWSTRLTTGVEYGVDALNPVPGQKILSRDGHRTNDLSTKDITVLDNELDFSRLMPDGNKEVLRPD